MHRVPKKIMLLWMRMPSRLQKRNILIIVVKARANFLVNVTAGFPMNLVVAIPAIKSGMHIIAKDGVLLTPIELNK